MNNLCLKYPRHVATLSSELAFVDILRRQSVVHPYLVWRETTSSIETRYYNQRAIVVTRERIHGLRYPRVPAVRMLCTEHADIKIKEHLGQYATQLDLQSC